MKLSGHFAVFDRWTEINSSFEGNFMERVASGAFARTFREDRDRMRVLFQHGQDVLGQQILGPIETLQEDKTGAYYEVPLLEGVPPLLLSGLRAGEYGASFRFQTLREEFVDRPQASKDNPTRLPERTIREAKVFEFGPVTFGAYSEATAGVRSQETRLRPPPSGRLEVVDRGLGSGPVPTTMRRLRRAARTSAEAGRLVRVLERGGRVELCWAPGAGALEFRSGRIVSDPDRTRLYGKRTWKLEPDWRLP